MHEELQTSFAERESELQAQLQANTSKAWVALEARDAAEAEVFRLQKQLADAQHAASCQGIILKNHADKVVELQSQLQQERDERAEERKKTSAALNAAVEQLRRITTETIPNLRIENADLTRADKA